MKYFEILLNAVDELRANFMRTVLTMLGIIIGIASVVLIISLGEGATASITGDLTSFGGNIVTISPGVSAESRGPGSGGSSIGQDSLTFGDADAIISNESIGNISGVSGVISSNSTIANEGVSSSETVTGVDGDYQQLQDIDLEYGEFIDSGNSVSRIAVIGHEIAEEFFSTPEFAIGKSLRIDGKPFNVIGVASEKGGSTFSNPDRAIYVPLQTMSRILTGQAHLSSISVGVQDIELIDTTIERVNTLLMERHKIEAEEDVDFSISSPSDTLETVSSITGLLTALLSGIAAISLIVGGIGIMNIMLVTVTERTREVGLLKAIGAKKKDILGQFIIEAIVLTFSGGLIGVALGAVLNYFIADALNIPFGVTLSSILLAVGVSSFIGVVFGYYPARRAAGLNPIDALGNE